MYPHPPPSHRPTNYFWILVACIGGMLLFLFIALHSVADRFSSAVQSAGQAAPASSAPARPLLSLAPQPTSVTSAAPSASPQATPADEGVIDVDPKTLTQSPSTYRSRVVRVRGTVFYVGKVDNGRTWIQIVDANNIYVNGQSPDPVPPTVSKGRQVEMTGIGAGLINITAANGKDYDEANIDPVQKIELVSSAASSSFGPAPSPSTNLP